MSDAAQYVTLGLAGETFAVPVDRVQEILELRPIARLPHTPADFLGMIDVRGSGVPVVDLRAKLGLAPGRDDESTRIVVLWISAEARMLTLGLKADRVFEVTVLDGAELEPPPEIGTRWRSDCIAGMGRRNGAFVTVLDLDRLFSSDEIPLLASEAADAA
ncbi:MAG: chemotaxis protein CheW [Phenylobacterium sp.]|uniref:chemotaxis protein CheW n=1 Tax=Phenylobacterium sp. TaxID=1871053 RepID=UPI00391D54CC